MNEGVLLASLFLAGAASIQLAAFFERSNNYKKLSDPAEFAGLTVWTVGMCVGLAMIFN